MKTLQGFVHRWMLGFLLAVAIAQPATLASRVQRVLAATPLSKSALVGVLVTDEKGRRLVALNANRLFVPASITKLFTTALALEHFGPEKRFETRVELRGRDLALVGTGDANLSGRIFPYQYDSRPNPPLTAIDELASQLAASGLTSVDGDVIGDDSQLPFEPYAPGWSTEDTLADDGAPVSALVVNDNRLEVRVKPGLTAGTPAIVTIDPPLSLFETSNNILTADPKPGRIFSDRILGTNLWRLWGSIPPASPDYVEHWAVDDPGRFAALALKTSLASRGINVGGTARAFHRVEGLPFVAPEAGRVLARRESPALLDDLRLINKVSQNLHADLLLCLVGGSRQGGLAEMDRFLGSFQVPREAYAFHDGCGLSRRNIVTPETVVALLRHMAQGPYQESYLATLPVAGVDGSLAMRLTRPRTRGRIFGKTGTLDHVGALCGYVRNRRSQLLSFAVFVNNANASGSEIRELIDKIAALLVD